MATFSARCWSLQVDARSDAGWRGRYDRARDVRIAFAHGTDTDGDGLLDKGKGKGRKVTLRTDPSQATYDRYHRLLAYARVKGGRSLAETQLKRGWAKVYVFNHKPFKLTKRFRRIAKKAKQDKRGAWGACGGHFHVPAG